MRQHACVSRQRGNRPGAWLRAPPGQPAGAYLGHASTTPQTAGTAQITLIAAAILVCGPMSPGCSGSLSTVVTLVR